MTITTYTDREIKLQKELALEKQLAQLNGEIAAELKADKIRLEEERDTLRQKLAEALTDTITLPRSVIEQAIESMQGYARETGDTQPCDAEKALSAALAQQAEQDEVGINGLTDAETRATMSVRGLSKPKKKKLTSYERKCFNDWKNP